MAGFFQNGSSLDLIEVEELLLYRYHNIEYIMALEINEGILLINKALTERDNRKYWEMWLSRYQWMDKESYVSFEDFRDMLTGENIVMKSRDEIIVEIREIEKKAQQKRGEVNGIRDI